MNKRTKLLEDLLKSLNWARDNSNRFTNLNQNEWESGYCVGYDTAIENTKSLILARLKEKVIDLTPSEIDEKYAKIRWGAKCTL